MNFGTGQEGGAGAPRAAHPPPAKVSNPIFDRLRAVQDEHHYLPHDQLIKVAEDLNMALSQVHASASFYPHFRTQKQANVQVRVCCDMACHIRGGGPLLSVIQQHAAGMQDVLVKEVSCLGQCDGAPAMSVNDQVFRNVDVNQAETLIADCRAGRPLPEPPVQPTIDFVSNPYKNSPRYGALRKAVQDRNWEQILGLLEAANLMGMGGAFFPTHRKWRTVREQPDQPKYVVCNADESEPGTIKDRVILTHLPHLVIEGMILAGLVSGARNGVLYIRHEYKEQEKILEEEIHRCHANKLIGPSILGTELAFELELFVSPGGYILGEESALLEAIEGKRGEPRNKPSIPVFNGLWQKPTVLNNVETFAHVPQILANGVDWYKAQGHHEGTAGLKFVGVSGDVENPGVFEIPMGMPVRDVISRLAGGIRGGKKLKAYAPSGPSSGYLPASKDGLGLDFKSMKDGGSMLGSGAIVVCAEGRCMLDMALNPVSFFRRESCGKCVPCRVGSRKMEDILTAWTRGQGTKEDLKLVEELIDTLKLTSICGLGQFAHSPISSVLAHFREEVEAHVLRRKCPEGVCPMR